MKHIVLFSGGASSSYTAYLVLKKVNRKDIILLHTPTYSEHPEADRFREDVSNFLNIPITVQADGRDIWKLIEDRKYIPSQFMPFCTQQLKINQSEKFFNHFNEDFVQYIGYGINEWSRVQRTYTRNLVKKRIVQFPVFESGLSDEKIKNIIKNDWGIKLPDSYKYLKHNNCIPCFKAGKAEWKNFYLYFPEQYKKAIDAEKKTGYTVFKDISLEKLAEIFKHNKKFEDKQISMFEHLPCECMI
jgi:3'-phosphoadenosine 5'-phosphosulfate sulfotransferase (PAPS reductase)/FAD synthetase